MTPAEARVGVEPEQAAKVAIARRAKPSALRDHVKLVLTLDLCACEGDPRGEES